MTVNFNLNQCTYIKDAMTKELKEFKELNIEDCEDEIDEMEDIIKQCDEKIKDFLGYAGAMDKLLGIIN